MLPTRRAFPAAGVAAAPAEPQSVEPDLRQIVSRADLVYDKPVPRWQEGGGDAGIDVAVCDAKKAKEFVWRAEVILEVVMRMLTVLLIALGLAAAPQGTPPSQLQRMVGQLNVTPEQKGKLDPILAEDAKLVRALRTSGLSDDDQAKKKAEIRQASDEKIKPILTGEQWKKLAELRADNSKKGTKKK
jgi:Spy/CpxP family protein refolding chaperone